MSHRHICESRCPRLMHRHTRSLLAGLCLAPVAAAAQSTSSTTRQSGSARYGHTTAVPTAVATRREGRIVLDGKLDEPAWRAATPITEFTQFDPDEGRPASQRTEVRFLFDDDAAVCRREDVRFARALRRHDTARTARRELRFRLFATCHRFVSRSPEPRVLRGQSVRLAGGSHRHRQFVL